jgi:protein-disulfide isomerase
MSVMLLMASGGMGWWLGSPAYVMAQPGSLSTMASIEPAEGAAAEGEGAEGPKKAASGKVLTAPTLPTVTIGGMQVITKEMLYQQELESSTPASLKSGNVGDMLKRRTQIIGYAHNPALGPEDAKLKLVEMTDLSCVQCMETSKVVDAIMEKYKDNVRLINIHAPVNTYNDVNLPAFYGKVAQRGGIFWAYRKALQTLQNPTPDNYFETLVTAGMDRLEARRLLQTESRRFYRELDADAALAEQLHVGNPPHVFVNGIHVGVNAIALEKLADVVTYEMTRPQRDESYQP